jgi:CRISPR-associated protein Cas6
MRMSDVTPDMGDIVFPLSGRDLPEAYAHELWRAVAGILPWIEKEEYAGILPLRTAAEGAGELLPKRARLVLRVPVERLPEAYRLSGQVLDVGGHSLSVGDGKERPLQPHPTLHAHLVASAEPEEKFLSGVAAELRELGVSCKWICGKQMTVAGEPPISGYSLVLHELKPNDSLRMQYVGLGAGRRYGCGIFIPYKVIPNLD